MELAAKSIWIFVSTVRGCGTSDVHHIMSALHFAQICDVGLLGPRFQRILEKTVERISESFGQTKV